LPEFLTEREINKLIDGVSDLRDKTILEVMYSTGCRPKELREMKISCMDLVEGEIKVMGKDWDGAYRKERFVLFTKRAMVLLKKYLKQRIPKQGFEDTVFLNDEGEALTPQELNRMVKRHIKELLLRDIKHPNTAYIIRHSFATHLLNRGVDLIYISIMMGHRNVVATQFYTHLAVEKLCLTHKKFHPRENPQAIRPWKDPVWPSTAIVSKNAVDWAKKILEVNNGL
jgi:integrase/recombinase XerD